MRKTCGRRLRYDAQQITAHFQQPHESWIAMIEDTLAMELLDATAKRIQYAPQALDLPGI